MQFFKAHGAQKNFRTKTPTALKGLLDGVFKEGVIQVEHPRNFQGNRYGGDVDETYKRSAFFSLRICNVSLLPYIQAS